MLKQFKVHNFRTFLNAEFEFTERHLLIGKNNSGKTNLCCALRFLAATATQDLSQAVAAVPGGINEIRNWASNIYEISLACTCELPLLHKGATYNYALRLVLLPALDPVRQVQLELRVIEERLDLERENGQHLRLISNDGQTVELLNEQAANAHSPPTYVTVQPPPGSTMLSKIYSSDAYRSASWFKTYLTTWSYYSLGPSDIRRGWTTQPSTPIALSASGDNLASVLYQMKNMDEERYRRVISHAQKVEPMLEAVNFVLASGQVPVPFASLRSGIKGASWAGLSDGTLRCLALATIIEYTSTWYAALGWTPPLVMIEEPENGLYPGQLRAIYELFEDRAPGGQFLFTSHSPYFINLFDGFRERVTLLRRNNERTEVLRPPPPDADPDRELLAEQFSMELIG